MRRTAACAAAALLALAPARAQDAVFTGALKCDAIPSMNLPELNARVTITQQGDRLAFVREFRDAQGIGGRETAVGTLASGKATLTGGGSITNARGGTSELQSRFEATLAGGAITLTGRQTWSSRNRSAARDCTGLVRR